MTLAIDHDDSCATRSQSGVDRRSAKDLSNAMRNDMELRGEEEGEEGGSTSSAVVFCHCLASGASWTNMHSFRQTLAFQARRPLCIVLFQNQSRAVGRSAPNQIQS